MTATARKGRSAGLSAAQKKNDVLTFASGASSMNEVVGYAVAKFSYAPSTIKRYVNEAGIKFGSKSADTDRKKKAADAKSAQAKAVEAFQKQAQQSDRVENVLDEAEMLLTAEGPVPSVEALGSARAFLESASGRMRKTINDREEAITKRLPDGVYDNADGSRAYEIKTKTDEKPDAEQLYDQILGRCKGKTPEEAMEVWDEWHGAGSYRDGPLRRLAGEAGIDHLYGEVVEGEQTVQPFVPRAQAMTAPGEETFKGHSIMAAREASSEYWEAAEQVGAPFSFTEKITQTNAGAVLSELERAKGEREQIDAKRKEHDQVLAGLSRPGDVIVDTQNRPVGLVTSGNKYYKPQHAAIKEMAIDSSKTGQETVRKMRAVASTTWKKYAKDLASQNGATTVTERKTLREKKA